MNLSLPQLIAVYAIPVILAITLHEAAHAWLAARLGDPTARLQGRVSANPLRHVDPIGTLLVPALILLVGKALGAGGLLFGWAKPVPVDASAFRSPRRDLGLVAAAGPGANLLMALGWAILLKLLVLGAVNVEFLVLMAQAGILCNLGLAVLNLLPVPPLDGGRIVASFLPLRAAIVWYRLERFGLLIVLALLATGLLGAIITPAIGLGVDLISWLFNFSG
ncbi:MAG: site-2 protease family protein [Burkholderiaceae bacterium]|jgi:Zn-dependent protease|nr:site-2 protease family protein [Betaproteobacteria bacterium]